MQCYFIYSMSKSLCHLDFFYLFKIKIKQPTALAKQSKLINNFQLFGIDIIF